MNEAIPVKLRLANLTDKNFIFSKWLKNYKFSSRFAKRIKNDVFYKWHQLILENIMARPSCSVVIAHPIDDPDVNLGFICYENQNDTKIIHYVFVKPEFRNFGLGRTLYNHAMNDSIGGYFTHWTYPLDTIEPKLIGMTYDPYRI
jgi:hypothetical protein